MTLLMECRQLISDSSGVLDVVLLQESVEDVLSLLLYLHAVTAQDSLYLRLRLCGGNEINP